MSQKFGIDVSHWQGDFNFARAKSNEGVEFAILKAGGGDAGLYKDSKFEANYEKCEDCGLPKGAYFYGNAKSVAEAKKEAEYFISILSGKKYEYPVFYDVEGKMITDNDRATLTEIVKAFCSTMEAAGYWVGIYSSESFFNSEMNDGELTRYSHWVARWGKSKLLPVVQKHRCGSLAVKLICFVVIKSMVKPAIRIIAMWIILLRLKRQDSMAIQKARHQNQRLQRKLQ